MAEAEPMMSDAGQSTTPLASSLYVEVTSLVEQELYSSAVTLGQFMLASAGGINAPPSCAVMLADALYGAGEWRRASAHYGRGVESGGRLADGGGVDAVRARVRMAQCSVQLAEPDAAKQTLEQIPEAERPAHVWMQLGQLLSAAGSAEPAIACYKQVMRLNPYAVEAYLALNLLCEENRVEKIEPVPAELLPTAAGVVQQLSNAHSHVVREEVREALGEFKDLRQRTGPTTHVLVVEAKLHAELRDPSAALHNLEQARELDPNSLEGSEVHARLLAKAGAPKRVTLSQLTQSLLHVDKCRAEPWIASAYFWSSATKPSLAGNKNAEKDAARRAVDYAEKAVRLAPNSADALHTYATMLARVPGRGNSAAKKESLESSAAAFRKLLGVERCLRPFEGLVGVQVASGLKEDLRQALTRAGEAMRKWPQAPRAYAMMGSVLASPLVKDHTQKAKQAFQKAVELGNKRNPAAAPDPEYLVQLVDLCLLEDPLAGHTRENGVQDALKVRFLSPTSIVWSLLDHVLGSCPGVTWQLLTSWGARTDSVPLNLKLGEVLCMCPDASHHQDAVETYQRALTIDPQNKAAKRGLSALLHACFS